MAIAVGGAVGAASLTETMKSCSNIDCGCEVGGGIYFTLSWSRLRPLSMFALQLFSADAGPFAGTTSARDHLSVTPHKRKMATLETRYPAWCAKCNKDTQSTFII